MAQETGTIVWHDLTVGDAPAVRDFYSAVVGWTATPHGMGDYDDYVMHTADTGDTVAGVCHARGSNAALPPQWLLYVQVSDVAAACDAARGNGGDVVDGPRPMGGSVFAVVRDPAGAVMALIEPIPATRQE